MRIAGLVFNANSGSIFNTNQQLVPDSELNQVGGIPGVLTFDHTWRLEVVDGGTRVTQSEEYRGIGVLFWDPAWVEEAYEQANFNLRDRVESL